MIYILAVLLPFLAVMMKGRIGTGILLLLLQLTVIGWIPAIVIAVLVINRQHADTRNKELIEAIKTNRG